MTIAEKELEHILEKYSSGYCIWLTLALHDKYGWDIHAQIDFIENRHEKYRYVSHSFVTMPNGYEVDIYGPQEMVDRFTSNVVKLNRKQFIDLIGESNPESDIEFEYQEVKEEVDSIIELLLEPMFV